MISLIGGAVTLGGAGQCRDEAKGVDYCNAPALASQKAQVTSFLLDEGEVTNRSYRYCVDMQICPEPVHTGTTVAPDYFFNATYDDFPVVFVTWDMAEAYCRFVGKRLPSEAEWEFAARRAVDPDPENNFPWGNNANNNCEGNLAGCNAQPMPVAVKSSGDTSMVFKIRDLGGNVAEWVADTYNPFAYCVDGKSVEARCADDASCTTTTCATATCVELTCAGSSLGTCAEISTTTDNPLVIDPQETKRVFRGGSYATPTCGAMASFRYAMAQSAADSALGFRCAKDAP